MEFDSSGARSAARYGLLIFLAGSVQAVLFPIGYAWWTAAGALALTSFSFLRVLNPPQFSHSEGGRFNVTHVYTDSPAKGWTQWLGFLGLLAMGVAFFGTLFVGVDNYYTAKDSGVLAMLARDLASLIPIAIGGAAAFGWELFAVRSRQ